MLPSLARASGDSPLWSDLMTFGVPPAEKVTRTVLVYLAIWLLLRLAGKRQLAQLSSFDLVVVLLLSNVVQNAIIGQDNSLVGGLLGAAVLVLLNSAVGRLALTYPRAARWFEGSPTVIASDGQADEAGLRRVGLSQAELLHAIRLQGADELEQTQDVELLPNGMVMMELKPEERTVSRRELDDAIAALRGHLDARLDRIEASLARS
ncbi:MAG TPA: YetF domain-containing protein [Candidatus Lustribacter sp.]|nr:YetF domain-containing protein [Candidatus Lustribacter sp.]